MLKKCVADIQVAFDQGGTAVLIFSALVGFLLLITGIGAAAGSILALVSVTLLIGAQNWQATFNDTFWGILKEILYNAYDPVTGAKKYTGWNCTLSLLQKQSGPAWEFIYALIYLIGPDGLDNARHLGMPVAADCAGLSANLCISKFVHRWDFTASNGGWVVGNPGEGGGGGVWQAGVGWVGSVGADGYYELFITKFFTNIRVVRMTAHIYVGSGTQYDWRGHVVSFSSGGPGFGGYTSYVPTGWFEDTETGDGTGSGYFNQEIRAIPGTSDYRIDWIEVEGYAEGGDPF